MNYRADAGLAPKATKLCRICNTEVAGRRGVHEWCSRRLKRKKRRLEEAVKASLPTGQR